MRTGKIKAEFRISGKSSFAPQGLSPARVHLSCLVFCLISFSGFADTVDFYKLCLHGKILLTGTVLDHDQPSVKIILHAEDSLEFVYHACSPKPAVQKALRIASGKHYTIGNYTGTPNTSCRIDIPARDLLSWLDKTAQQEEVFMFYYYENGPPGAPAAAKPGKVFFNVTISIQ